MPGWLIAVLIILGVILIALIGILIYGRNLQKKSEASQADVRASAQMVSILIIDKKRMKLKEAGFPQVVIDQTPKYMRGAKVPVVKAKAGPKVVSMLCDEKIFDLIPVKKEVKALINGIYIIDVKGLRGGLEAKAPKKKFLDRMKDKVSKNEKDSKKNDKPKESKKGKK